MSVSAAVDRMVSRWIENPDGRAAGEFRQDLLGLIRMAKAEQHIVEMEKLVNRPEMRNAFFSIDSMR